MSCAHQEPGNKAVTSEETGPDLPASTGGSPGKGGGQGQLWLTPGIKTLAAAASASTHWHEDAQRLP